MALSTLAFWVNLHHHPTQNFFISPNWISQFSSIQLLSHVWLFATPWAAERQASLSITNSEACSNSCHPAISFSVTLFCPQSFSASGSSSVSQFFASGGQSIGVLASASVLPMNIQDWFPLGLISLLSRGLSRGFSSTVVWKHYFFSTQPSLWSLTSIHDHWKNHSLDEMDLCRQSNVSDF